jgi:hypothetical protein
MVANMSQSLQCDDRWSSAPCRLQYCSLCRARVGSLGTRAARTPPPADAVLASDQRHSIGPPPRRAGRTPRTHSIGRAVDDGQTGRDLSGF